MDLLQELKKCLLFAGLPEDDLKELSRSATVKSFSKKTLIFSEGDEATGFYVLLTGMVKIYKLSPDSREQILHIINPYSTFAEAAIFIGKTYPAFAETILDSAAAYFDKKNFLKTLETKPKVSMNFIISLSMLLKKVVDLVDDVSLKKVDVRLAEYILEEAVKRGRKHDDTIEIELSITKTELAKRLGTVNETLSRMLRKLKDNGIIDTEKNKIYVYDLKALQQIKEDSRFQPF